MSAPLSEAEKLARFAAWVEGEAKGLTKVAVAQALGISPKALENWLVNNRTEFEAFKAGRYVAPEQPTITIPELPDPPAREVRDLAFWKRKAADLQKQRDEAEFLAEQLAGLREVPTHPPDWSDMPKSPKGRSIIIAHTSDLHMGEVVRGAEVGQVNAYDPDIAADRMRRFFAAVCEVGQRWVHDNQCDGVLLTMGGDLISGDIHDELSRTNAMTSHDQVARVVDVYSAGLGFLLDVFQLIHIMAVGGNHGRTTHKPVAKLAARMSYDTLAASMLRRQWASNERVTWNIPDGPDAILPLYGRNILLTHGDKIGTGGGQGFVGPALPIMRGVQKLRAQYASQGTAVDLVLMGHYHTSMAGPGLLANGSVVGFSEYGQAIRGAAEPPKQWMARYSAHWGLCEHMAVQLAETRPRVRFK